MILAAHCILNKEGEAPLERNEHRGLLPRQVIVLLGAYNISKFIEVGRVASSIQKIVLHDEWIPSIENFDADIAILILEEDVHLSRFIGPICLPKEVTRPTSGKHFVAGWGLSEETADQSIPKMIRAPIVNNQDCFRDKFELSKMSSGRTFCAGTADGAGVCLGDSGHGLFTQSNDIFYLDGIVSSSLLSFGGVCDVTTYAIYTNVTKFLVWITKTMSET